MSIKVKRILGCILTIMLIAVLMSAAGHLLDPAWTEGGFDAVKAFHSQEKNSLDVIIYGSSHAWKGCDTRVMYDEYGLQAYNYGCNWQNINTTDLFLADSLRTQTPKVVCIETFFVNGVLKDTDMDGQIYYTRAIPPFKEKIEYLKGCFGNDPKRWVSYYMPLVMFHDNWNTINAENFQFSEYQRFVETRGFNPGNSVNPIEITDYRKFPQEELKEDSLEILDDIVARCREKNISIVFYVAPYGEPYRYIEAMSTYAEQNGCVFLNTFEYMDEIGIRADSDFQDVGHLNTEGSKKMARFLAEYIIENYDVPHTVK